MTLNAAVAVLSAEVALNATTTRYIYIIIETFIDKVAVCEAAF